MDEARLIVEETNRPSCGGEEKTSATYSARLNRLNAWQPMWCYSLSVLDGENIRAKEFCHLLRVLRTRA